MIGFMQGRLSPLVRERIQAFPTEHWREEFPLAREIRFEAMEWLLDRDSLTQNPLMSSTGRREIKDMCGRYECSVRSVTADVVMQTPFYKAEFHERQRLIDELKRILEACADLDVRLIVIPLVDNGSLQNSREQECLHRTLEKEVDFLKDANLRIAFESDYPPHKLAEFLNVFDETAFGMAFDMGDRASLGFEPKDDLDILGPKIFNVHVKDRILGGYTVPFTLGHVKFEAVFYHLNRIQYQGDYILQPARAADGNHFSALHHYYQMVKKWLEMAKGRES